jgi:hypothetical protein
VTTSALAQKTDIKDDPPPPYDEVLERMSLNTFCGDILPEPSPIATGYFDPAEGLLVENVG